MSSIRPLATITVLAIVGVFLYMKINETEPQLPPGVDEWSVSTEIQLNGFGGDASSLPEVEMSPAGGAPPADNAAPAFAGMAVDTSAAVSGSEAPAYTGQAAPTWNAPPGAQATQVQPSASVAIEASAQSTELDEITTNVSASNEPSYTEPLAAADSELELPDLPPMPELPAAVTPAEQVEPAPTANSAVPSVDLSNTATSGATSESPAAAPAQASLFSATRLAVQSALDRGELSQALLLLSDWYGDPSLSSEETAEVNSLLSQLAGSVIYSTEPRLEPPYMVQAGERLETIAEKFQVPWQLLAKINGITSADQVQPGQKLKVLRGPFSAVVDISRRRLTLMLDRRYAGQFTLEVDPSITVEEGHWKVDQKMLTPGNVGLSAVGPVTPTEERSITLTNVNGTGSKIAVLRGTSAYTPLSELAGRVIRLKPADAADVFDILSLGSKVVIRR